MREKKTPHIHRVQFDTLGNCFPFGIVLCDWERVARLLVRFPHINSRLSRNMVYVDGNSNLANPLAILTTIAYTPS